MRLLIWMMVVGGLCYAGGCCMRRNYAGPATYVPPPPLHSGVADPAPAYVSPAPPSLPPTTPPPGSYYRPQSSGGSLLQRAPNERSTDLPRLPTVAPTRVTASIPPVAIEAARLPITLPPPPAAASNSPMPAGHVPSFRPNRSPRAVP